MEAAHASPTNGTTPLHLTAAGSAAGAVTAAHLLTVGVSADALAFSGLCAGDLLPHANATAERGTGSSLCAVQVSRGVPSSSPKKYASPLPAPELSK